MQSFAIPMPFPFSNEETEKARIHHEAQKMGLKEMFADYGKHDRFKPGDWVTPKATAPLNNIGEPHLVVEVLDGFDTKMDFAGRERLADIRVMVYVDNESISPFWGESWLYEPYVEKD